MILFQIRVEIRWQGVRLDGKFRFENIHVCIKASKTIVLFHEIHNTLLGSSLITITNYL